jgi:hypothetical protein
MRGIKLFTITYDNGQAKETKEWPAQSADHALKRFTRARTLSSQGPVKVISVAEVKPR